MHATAGLSANLTSDAISASRAPLVSMPPCCLLLVACLDNLLVGAVMYRDALEQQLRRKEVANSTSCDHHRYGKLVSAGGKESRVPLVVGTPHSVIQARFFIDLSWRGVGGGTTCLVHVGIIHSSLVDPDDWWVL